MKTYESDSEGENYDIVSEQPNCWNEISVVKYLSRARSIMTKHIYDYTPLKCIFELPLRKVNPQLLSSSTYQHHNRQLIAMEVTEFQHQRMKEKIDKIYRKQPKLLHHHTLEDLYGKSAPYYTRFVTNKTDFSSVLVSVKGIDIKPAKKHKPQLPKLITPSTQKQNATIKFDSHFQSGNLLYAFRKSGEVETYDLLLQNDINSRGNNDWFFFRVTNTAKNKKIKINIVNFIKSDSLFNYGLKILTLSEARFNKTGKGWMREGQLVTYQQSNLRREHKEQNLYTLSFEYTFREENDSVYMCPSYPYTYTTLTSYLQRIFAHPSIGSYISIKKLGETLGGNVVNIVSICGGQSNLSDKNSKVVWILARQHPGQTTSSFMVEGIIDYLIELFTNSNAISLQQYTFKIIPMVNVDGVIHGNSRTQLSGVDPNRLWGKPTSKYSPIIKLLKKYILQTKSNISLLLDLHSQSKKTGCFFYGNENQENNNLAKLYPFFVCKNDERFTMKNCRFKRGQKNSLRKVLSQELQNTNVFTVECSLYGYHKNNKIIQFTPNDYRDMGRTLIVGYFNLEKQNQTKSINEIIASNPQIEQELQNQCESARSNSSLSDEEYQQVRAKKFKSHQKSHYLIRKKINPNSQQNVFKIQKQMFNHQQPKTSLKNPKEVSSKKEVIQKEISFPNRQRSSKTPKNENFVLKSISKPSIMGDNKTQNYSKQKITKNKGKGQLQFNMPTASLPKKIKNYLKKQGITTGVQTEQNQSVSSSQNNILKEKDNKLYSIQIQNFLSKEVNLFIQEKQVGVQYNYQMILEINKNKKVQQENQIPKFRMTSSKQNFIKSSSKKANASVLKSNLLKKSFLFEK